MNKVQLNKHRAMGRLLPYGGGLLLVVLLVSQIDPSAVFEMIRNAGVGWLLIGCGWYLCTNWLRAFRFGTLLKFDKWGAIASLLPEMFALSFLNNVLPSRTGELSFPYLMQRRHQVSIGESTTALLLARLFDYLAVITLYVVFALVELNNLEASAARIIWIVVLLSLLSIALLMIAPWLSTLLYGLAERWIRQRELDSGKAGAMLLRFGQEVVIALNQMRSVSIYLKTYGWSLGIWLCTFAWFGAFLNAIGIPVRYTLVVVGATFASLAKALPFITIGGFGAHEAGWTLGFSLIGMEQSTAITSGFAVNILTLSMSILFGGAALLWMRMGWPQNDQPQKERHQNDHV